MESRAREAFDTNPFSGSDSKRYAGFPSLACYLRSIIGMLNQHDILGCVARLTPYKHIFAVPFSIQTLPTISTKTTAVPQSAKDGKAVIERAVNMEI